MRFVVLLFLLLLPSSLVFSAQQKTAKAPALTPLQQQRAWYAAADRALAKKQTQEFQRLLAKLQQYPLKPYLEYKALLPQLSSMPKSKVDNFLSEYPNSLLATRLTQQWLRQLAIKKQWADYIHYYDSRLADTELTCLYLEARLKTDDPTAMDQVAAVWNQGKSLPPSCDNLIDAWKAAGYRTKQLLWQRFIKATNAGEAGLASYLSTQLPAAERSYALVYQQVNNNPALLKTPAKFKQQNPYVNAILLRGIYKQAASNPVKAKEYFDTYYASHKFAPEESSATLIELGLQLLKQKHPNTATQLISGQGHVDDPVLLDALLRHALSQQDWERVNAWLQRYPDPFKTSDKWRYWMARTMEALNIHEYMGQTSQGLYASLAENRSFHGFLSAIKLQKPFALVDRPVVMDKLQWAHIESTPGFMRAREFFLTGNKAAANQEWFFTLKRIPEEEVLHAAHLASKWDNHLLAIQTMSAAQYYDDLSLRFPIKYEAFIDQAARETGVDKRFIISIIRQESAFTQDIKSSANAQGLMQLLPSTAKEVARRNKIAYQPSDLLKGQKNIPLGSRFLKSLLDSFDGHHALTAAAYNAGQGRVRQWRALSNGKLPLDIWVEVIPFNETRQYVQNVLAFKVIYAYRLGLPQEMLTQKELETFL